MRKISDWQKYNFKHSQSIKDALLKMNSLGLTFLVISDESGRCIGVITDGDIRRSLVDQNEINLDDNIMLICNTDFDALVVGDENKFSPNKRIKFLPVIDSTRHLQSIASIEPEKFIIGDVEIGQNCPVFIIAEIGNNHNGDFELAKRLIEQAAAAGANCVKFQMRDLASLYENAGNNNYTFDLATEYTLDLLNKFQLPSDKLLTLFDYCWKLSVIPLCTPWDLKSLEILSTYGMPGYKIASPDLTNVPLLEGASRTNRPIIISTGMSSDEEIRQAAGTLDSMLCQYAFLHCNSTYPAPFSDINLSYMKSLKSFGQGIVGYSGHERGHHIPIAAVALGANIIEKHFTLDKNMEGVDHKVSLLPGEFSLMVKQIRTTEEAMNSTEIRKISQGEMINRENLSKSLFYKKDLNAGTTLKKTDFVVKSPGNGIQPAYIGRAIGKQLLKSVKSGEKLQWSHVEKRVELKTTFGFNSEWGFPVRYHDIETLVKISNPKVLEIHLSYLDIGKEIPNVDCDLSEVIVHAPELFENDHILDLSLSDGEYLKQSLVNFERTIEEALRISKTLNSSKLIKIVFNAGGATNDGFLNDTEREQRYVNLINNLRDYHEVSGIELLPQTMPPYPWHFGGRSFHNLFVDPDDIIKFHKNTGVRFCIDLSHTKLSCTYLGIDFNSSLEKLLTTAAHLHIADAAGESGEGLQIGDGEIEWSKLKPVFENLSPDVTWIPEIWQGHTNNNLGVFSALQKLEIIMP